MIDERPLIGRPIVVLDVETDRLLPPTRDLSEVRITLAALWDYGTMQLLWFDESTLLDLLWRLTERPSLLVTYDGLAWDLALLSQALQRLPTLQTRTACWQQMVQRSCDLLARFWAAAPATRFTTGIHRFAQVCMANGLGMTRAPQGAIPHLWATGQVAAVMNHCQDDVLRLRQLFALGYQTQGVYQRYGSPVTITMPDLTAWPTKETTHGVPPFSAHAHLGL
jgi:hypothetical protein